MSRYGEISKTLYIANFPKDTQKHQLEELFSPYGKIANLAIVNKEKFSFAFADFETIEDAKAVQEKFDQKPYKEMIMKVSFKEKKENGHTNYQKPSEYSTPTTHNGEFKGAPHGQKSSFSSSNYASRKPDDKDQRRSDSESSRERKNSIDRVPRDRSRSKGYRRQESSEESSGRHEIKRRPTEIRPRSNSKDIGYIKPRYTEIPSRQDSKKIISLEKEILELSKEVHFLTKRLNRVENQFEEFIDEYNNREHTKRR